MYVYIYISILRILDKKKIVTFEIKKKIDIDSFAKSKWFESLILNIFPLSPIT